MKKVSVIVPVYNAASFLEECIQSITGQEYWQYELLLIDNGSTDGSREICEKYAKKDERIHILEQHKKGASAVRNMGIEAAEGEYIVFIDADDYIPGKEALTQMADALEQSGADIAVGNYSRLWNGKVLPAKQNDSFSGYDRDSASFWFEGFFSGGILSYVWCKMYRTSFLKENKLCFGDYIYAEDKMFNFGCYLCGAKYAFVESVVYVYRKNDVSVSHSYRQESCKCWMQIAEDLQNFICQRGLEEEYNDLVADTIFFAVFFDAKMHYIHAGRTLEAVKRVLSEYRGYPLAETYFKKFARGKGIKNLPSFLWKGMFFGFSVAMYWKWYTLLALGIKLLVGIKMDEHLSDTGLRK